MTGPILGSYECCGASNANRGEHYAWCRNSPEKRAAVREESDAVKQPDHYRLGGVEVIDAICAWGFGEGFNRGNAIKYIARAGRKDPAREIEDIQKAQRYLEMEERRLKGEPLTQDADPAATARAAKVQRLIDQHGTHGIFVVPADAAQRVVLGTALADSVQDENGRHHVDVQLNAAPSPIPTDADEQAAETIERLRADVYRLEQALIREKRDHDYTRRAAGGGLP